LLLTDDGFKAKMVASTNSIADWKALPNPIKKILADDSDFRAKIGATVKSTADWKALPDPIKSLLLNDGDFITKLASSNAKGKSFSTQTLIKTVTADASKFNVSLKDLGIKTSAVEKKPVTQKFNADTTQANTDIFAVANPPYLKKPTTITAAANTKDANNKLDTTQNKKNNLSKGKATAKVGVDTGNSIEKVKSVTKAIKAIPNKKPSVLLNGHYSASKARSIASEINKIKSSKTSNIYINTFRTTYTKTKKAGKNARGTANWKGGLSWVGDGGREEVVYQPDSGSLFKTPATDTLMDLEKHSIIWPSISRFNKEVGKLSIPKFATGTSNRAIEIAKYIPDIVDRTGGIGSTGAASLDSETTDSIGKTIAKSISRMNNITVNLTVNGDAMPSPKTIQKIKAAVVDGITKARNANRRAVGGALS